MTFETKYLTPDIKLSNFRGKIYRTEVNFEHHLLVWYISGETTIVQEDTTHQFGAGDIFLVPRNRIVTASNAPKDEKEHQAVSMHLTTGMLKEFYEKNPPVTGPLLPQKVVSFKKHPLLESVLVSLTPYFELTDPFPANIGALKIAEAISILRVVQPGIDSILANFDEPGKIDLTEFMEQHFMCNLPLEKFGYLTGRSLSTFNRDFRKLFHTTPQKWLTQRRLELAHYHLAEKKKRPVDVYLEVGFEDLSHFSFAFKKQFGYAPSHFPRK